MWVCLTSKKKPAFAKAKAGDVGRTGLEHPP